MSSKKIRSTKLIKNIQPIMGKIESQREFMTVHINHKKNDTPTILPIRGTKNSCGYDFVTPRDLVIKPQETVFFWTDVKVKMPKDEALLLDVRSSIGIKKDLMLANTIGILESDYFSNSDNDGNIGICLRNLKPSVGFECGNAVDLTEENTISLQKGERVAQAMFVKFGESDNCNTDAERQGGIGSTGVK